MINEPEQPLDSAVLHFIDQYIETVPHLEALLLMWQSELEWSVEQLAARIYVAPAAAQVILDDLMRHGMVRVQGRLYVFDREWDATQPILPQLAHTYRKHLTRVATLIHAKGPRSVRDFARAFKLKDKR